MEKTKERTISKVKTSDVPNIKQLTVTLKRCTFRNGTHKGQRGWFCTPSNGKMTEKWRINCG